MDLENKTIIVTGATSGIGLSLSEQLAEQGANLVLISRNKEKLADITDRLMSKHRINCWYFPYDLTNTEGIPTLIEQVLIKTKQIDGIINNAGFGLFAYAADTSAEITEKMFRLNVLAIIELNRVLLPHLRTRTSAQIVNIASFAGKIATPKASTYASTKSAVIGYSNALRLELKKLPVQVMTVNLGPVKTAFFTEADQSGSYQDQVAAIMLDPDRVSQKIIQHLFTKKREINLPGWMSIGASLYHLAPSLFETIMARQFDKK